MRAGAYHVALAICLGLHVGCIGLARHTSPPSSLPLPAAWRPEEVLRARIQVGRSGDIVLNDRDGLSPDEAALMALDQNPRLRALRAKRGLAQAEVLSAGILPNPRLDTSLETPTTGNEATVLGYGVGFTWNVTPLLSRTDRLAAARDNSVSVDLQVAWQEWQVAQAARLHAIRSIYLTRRLRLAQKIEDTWQQRLRGFRRAMAEKAVTAIQVATAERSLAEARVRKLEIRQQLAAERVALNQAIGLDALAEPDMETSWTPTGTVPSTESLLQSLPSRRLDLIALQHARRSHDHALHAALKAQFPPMEIGVRANRDVDQVGAAGVSLSFQIPFLDRNQGNIATQRAARVQSMAEYDARLEEARAEIVRLSKETELVDQQLDAAEEAEEAAVHIAVLARAPAKSGALSALVVAGIQERAFAAQLRKLEIEQLRAELRIALIMAAGTEG